jgi:hypothetical protein
MENLNWEKKRRKEKQMHWTGMPGPTNSSSKIAWALNGRERESLMNFSIITMKITFIYGGTLAFCCCQALQHAKNPVPLSVNPPPLPRRSIS